MRWSISISTFVHVAILLSAVVALPDPEKFEITVSEAVPVEILSEEDLAKLSKPENKPEPEKKPEPPKPEKPREEVKKPEKPKPKPEKQVAALPPKPEPEAKPVLTPPQAKPVEETPPEPVAKPEKAAEPEKQVKRVYPKPRTKPKPPKKKKPAKRFDDTIDALLNKLPDETPPPSPEPEQVDETQPRETASVAPVSQNGTQLERNDIAEIIRAGMARCWNPPIGVQNAGSLQVSFKVSLKRNGEFARNPQSQTIATDTLTRAAVESAHRALIRCAPYNLPADTYDIWKEMVLNFDPKSMF